ncbi:MarR family transcriptional regulator [Streptococcus iniae]
MDWVKRTDNCYKKLTEQDLAIITYLEKHQQELAEMTSQDLADACFVSRSSISRLLKKLEIDSFAELKFLLAQKESKAPVNQTDFSRVLSRYHRYIDQIFEKQDLHQLVKLLTTTNRLYVYGTGNAQKWKLNPCGICLLRLVKKLLFSLIKENMITSR